ncbi:SLD3-domain-containing protein [Hyphopichia burtonii NRRL Y-1933]|uniref:SLD3-domain-containing protein n=1 Tax=Hyphopichia burtonii NRRL Y-1933 TaxID=984485 RepID=A0A1E4RFI8_9ASCO|nr:SLD3-domain-containing protein [Hyphopichia burtonii NRRL Y-1933]ODV66018.1 SLD3-domain-containing protein [Hyphopichia burtonii NRRL Y-1933]
MLLGDQVRKGDLVLPFLFEARLTNANSTRQSYPLSITLLQVLENIDITSLPDDFHKQRATFKLEKDIEEMKLNYFYVKIQKQLSDKDWEVGLMYKIIDRYFGLITLPKGTKSKDIGLQLSCPMPSFDSSEEYLAYWKTDPTPKKGEQITNFSMKPPTILDQPKLMHQPDSPITLTSPQSENDPMKFLYARYFSILYSLNTPLSYFPKTSLVRFKNLCDNDGHKIKANLQKLYLTINEFDIRHEGRLGLLKSVDRTEVSSCNTKERYEIESQQEFVKKNHILPLLSKNSESQFSKEASSDTAEVNSVNAPMTLEEKLSALTLDLKVREAQLQILISLELISLLEIQENVFLDQNLKRQESEFEKSKKAVKPSLVRKRKNKSSKKIMPTFLGMGINVDELKVLINEPTTIKIDEYSLFSSMTTLVDRMGIWDTLAGVTTSKKDDSAFGFVAYVLIPYFNRKLPWVIKFIINKFKSLNPKLVPKKDRRSKSSNGSEDKKVSKPGVPIEKADSSSKPKDRSSRFPKKPLGSQRVPFLHKSSSSSRSNRESSLSDDLLPAFALKRSKSSLSTKNLERRQVDISVNLKDDSKISKSKSLTENDKLNRNKNLDFNKPSIFGDARRIKSTANSFKPVESTTQIEATPAKKMNGNPVRSHETIITATPSKDRILKQSQLTLTISQTPTIDRSSTTIIPVSTAKQPSVSERLMEINLKPPSYNQAITSSPVHEGSEVTSSPVAEKRHEFTIPDNSPVKYGITSSPVIDSSERLKRKRPGEPVSITESPFFNSTLNGSPFSSKGKSLYNDLNAARSNSVFRRGNVRKRMKSDTKIASMKLQNEIGNGQETDDDEEVTKNANEKIPNLQLHLHNGHDNDVEEQQANSQKLDDDSDSDFERLTKASELKSIKTYSKSRPSILTHP